MVFCHTLTWISHMCTCVPLSWTPFLYQLLDPNSQRVIRREPNDTGTCRNVLQKNAGLEESELLTQYPYSVSLLSILTQYPYYQIFPLLMREILYLPRLFAIQPWKDSSEQWMVSVLLRICAGTWWSHRGLLPNRVHLENDLLHQPLPDDQLVVSDTDPGESSCSTYATYCVLHN